MKRNSGRSSSAHKSSRKTDVQSKATNGNKPAGISATKNKALPQQRTYSIPDFRLEKPSFTVTQARNNDVCCFEISGDLSAPVPPIRDSNYLNKQQAME